MPVRIRMKRLGRKHRPYFRICVMDVRKPRDGKAIEEVGTYDPMVRDKSQRVTLKMDRIDHWLSVGAQPSEKVAVLIDKFKTGRWGETKSPPPMQRPQEKKPAEAESGDSAPTEEASTADA